MTRLLAPFTWRNKAARYAHFARAELSSRYDLLAAANQTPDPKRAAAFLMHAADEHRHARLFHARARELGFELPLRADFEHLYERLGEPGFLAFVHHGEARACRQFGVWIDHFKDSPRDRAILEAILPDEERHRQYTAVGEGSTGRVAVWEAGRTWLRMGRALSGGCYRMLAALLYLLAGPFFPRGQ